jgi:hypothetical protein
MTDRVVFVAALLSLSAACGGPGTAVNPSGAVSNATHPAMASPDATKVYQPLAAGNSWTYICNHQFTIVDQVIGTQHVNGRLVYVFSLQIPSSPTKSVHVKQLLANDPGGNTWIYGYVIHHKIHLVMPTKIVVPDPMLHAHYDYPAPAHGKISRVFVGFEYTNPTPLGTFWVAPYFESGGTHNYGYSKGRGVMEEDHGPNYKYDCLIEKYVLKGTPQRESH